ncbi:hypothetical protein GCM10022284_62440 [Streptomyces hundungensis]
MSPGPQAAAVRERAPKPANVRSAVRRDMGGGVTEKLLRRAGGSPFGGIRSRTDAGQNPKSGPLGGK